MVDEAKQSQIFKNKATLWFGLLGGVTLFVGVMLLLWESLLLLATPFKMLLCTIPFGVVSTWIWKVRHRTFHIAIEEVINTLWIGAWWFLALMICAISETLEVNAFSCLWVLLLTLPMLAIRYSHITVGLMTLLMPMLHFSVWGEDFSWWESGLFVICTFAPLVCCWYQWRKAVRAEGLIAIAQQWIYAVALLCYCSFWIPVIVDISPAFDAFFTKKINANLISVSLVAPLLLGSLEESKYSLKRRPLMFMSLCVMGGLSFMISTACLYYYFLDGFSPMSFGEHFLNAIAMFCVVAVATPKTFYREGLFLPFIPVLYLSLLLPHFLFILPLIIGAVMIWMSLRREDLFIAYLALGYSLVSLGLNLFALQIYSLKLYGVLLILCGILFFLLNFCYNRFVNRGEA